MEPGWNSFLNFMSCIQQLRRNFQGGECIERRWFLCVQKMQRSHASQNNGSFFRRGCFSSNESFRPVRILVNDYSHDLNSGSIEGLRMEHTNRKVFLILRTAWANLECRCWLQFYKRSWTLTAVDRTWSSMPWVHHFLWIKEPNLWSIIIFLKCCPGSVDTDMSSHRGKKTIEDG